MEALKKRVEELRAEVRKATDKIGLAELETEQKSLQDQMQKADFWQDSAKAQAASKREADLSRRIAPWQKLLQTSEELAELAASGDIELEKELTGQVDGLEKQFEELKKDLRFQGPFDDHDVILSIYAGAGGTDAQDWAKMLFRMYVRWAESHKFKVETID